MIGHQWAVNLLKQHILTQSVRHAYLFTGPDHVGKTTLAVEFARAINCTSGDPGTPCGSCRSCRLIKDQRHPDLHVLKKDDDRKAVRIEQVRELQYSLSLAPYEADRRIALLPDFHQATYHAWNALLKTLEEPSARVVLLLTAPGPEMLLPTIVSRCEVVHLRPVDTEDIEEKLAAEGFESGRLASAARMAMGSPGLAYSYMQNEDLLQSRYAYRDDIFEWLAMGDLERMQKVEDWMNWRSSFTNRQDQVSELLDTWVSLWRDVFHQQYGSTAKLIHAEAALDLQIVARSLRPELTLQQIKMAQTAREQIMGNVDPRLVLENLVLGLPHVHVSEGG